MTLTRVGTLAALTFAFVLATGAAAAGTAGSPRIMAFSSSDVHLTLLPVGGKGSPADALSTIGSTMVLSGRLANRTTQFGKPTGTLVGRLLLDCTVLNVPADGNCTGIVHVPDGFFLIGGNGPFRSSPRLYAITGGIGPYAGAGGQVTILTTSTKGSRIDVVVLPYPARAAT